MGRSLQKRGFEVDHAANLSAALELIEGSSYTHAVLDLNLGGENSLPLIAPLRRTNNAMKILILTGYASIATAVDAIKLGADNYLAKPADADEIMAALNAEGAVTGVTGQQAPAEPMSVRRLEWEHIQKVLKENDGNISATARQLKMHRRTLQRKLQKRPVAK